MKNILNLNQTCSELNLSYCRLIEKPSFYSSRTFILAEGVQIASVSTLVLLIILTFSLIRVHMHIYKKYAASARSELLLMCDLYTFSLMIELFLVSEVFNNKYIVILQTAVVNSIFAVLIWMSVFSTMFELLQSYSKVRFFASVHFVVSLIALTIFFKVPEIYFLNGLINISCVFLFFFIQTIKLKIHRSELWPYGNLFIGLIFFLLSTSLLFIGNELIAFLCNGYIDGLFLVHVFWFLSFLMLHKFWLSTCDYEIECATV